jgi:hypothetical protein
VYLLDAPGLATVPPHDLHGVEVVAVAHHRMVPLATLSEELGLQRRKPQRDVASWRSAARPVARCEFNLGHIDLLVLARVERPPLLGRNRQAARA